MKSRYIFLLTLLSGCSWYVWKTDWKGEGGWQCNKGEKTICGTILPRESCGKNAVVLYGCLGNNLFLFGKSCRNPEVGLKREHHSVELEVYKTLPSSGVPLKLHFFLKLNFNHSLPFKRFTDIKYAFHRETRCTPTTPSFQQRCVNSRGIAEPRATVTVQALVVFEEYKWKQTHTEDILKTVTCWKH